MGGSDRNIKEVRTYVHRCTGCFSIDKTASKVFCGSCGHKTMRRVPAKLNEDGTLQLFLAKNPKCLNPRGTRYTLPLPKGGKHSSNPILTDMQPRPQQKLSRKALRKQNPTAADYEVCGNAFADHDVVSKSFQLGLHLRPNSTKNPNQNRSK